MRVLFSGKRRLAVRIRENDVKMGALTGDVIGNETHIIPNFWERIKILFGCGILVEIAIKCETAPGPMITFHEVHFVRPSRAQLGAVEVERRSVEVERRSGDVMAQIADRRSK